MIIYHLSEILSGKRQKVNKILEKGENMEKNHTLNQWELVLEIYLVN